MADPQHIAAAVGILVGSVTLAKALWAIAQFFVGLSKGLENLTSAVRALTKRFDDHTKIVTNDLSDVRERVAALESWREAA